MKIKGVPINEIENMWVNLGEKNKNKKSLKWEKKNGTPTNENKKKVECEKNHISNSIFKKTLKHRPI
jgi:hypothetical protein